MAPTAAFAAKWLPKDFTEASSTGGFYTMIAYVVMVLVFFCELNSFLSSTPSSMVMLDQHDNELLQINFDIDMYDLECRNVRLVAYSQSNEEPLQIAASDFWLRSVDSKGRTFGMATKPAEEEEDGEATHQKEMKEVVAADGKKEIDADWASSHDGFTHKSFDHVIQGHDFTFINFFAGWCSHCQKFSPQWFELADEVNGDEASAREPKTFADRDGVQRKVRMIKMNCVDFGAICKEKGIDAYPMLRLYKADGSFSLFEGKRNKEELTRWLERTIKMKSYGWAAHHESFERGCNAKGKISVPRVPGHLEIMAGGGDQSLNPAMTNVSHVVKHLSFSDPDDKKGRAILPQELMGHVSPLDGRKYLTQAYHEAWIHDVKVMSTISSGRTTYQFTHQHRLAKIPVEKVPQAQIHFDIEPFAIYLNKDSKKWYDFVTSLMAMLGGVYAMMRLASTASLGMIAQMGIKMVKSNRGHLG